ncbi:MAG: HAMP domain-containing sensor histidine kinase [Deinococcota bacterium]
MRLRLRLSLLIALVTLAGLAFFATFAYALFVRQQDSQVTSMLVRDLERAQQLFRSPVTNLGLPIVDNEATYILQFVAPNGQVILPLGEDAPLPYYDTPSRINRTTDTEDSRPDSRLSKTTTPFLVSAVPWLSPSDDVRGSIRLAIDLSDILAARSTLLQSMVISGSVIAFLALIVGLIVVRRALQPLTKLARQAREVDPASPSLTVYQGPADEVADLAQALNTTLENIRERQDAERASLAEVAHELAAPLTLVAAHLNALEQAQLVSATHQHHAGESSADVGDVRAAREAANELLYTSQDLLTLARGELDQPFNLEIFTLDGVVERVAREYPQISLDIDPRAQDSEMAGSPRHLTQLVRNLVRNAVQASRGREVSIGLTCDGQDMVLEVRDCGAGIAPEDVPHVFDRFYSRRHGGTGVGLSVVKRIAEQHGGQVEVHSQVGEGTCMRVRLPSLYAQFDES